MMQAEGEVRPIPAGETRDRISTGKELWRQDNGDRRGEGEEEYLSTREGHRQARRDRSLQDFRRERTGRKNCQRRRLTPPSKEEAVAPETRQTPTRIEAQEKVKLVGWRKVIADRMISSARMSLRPAH